MRELSLSASSFHKSRAGTAYSVANRLLKIGLLERAQARDDVPENAVQVSRSGVEALRLWFEPPVPMADVAHSADLIRLRMFFLGVVEAEDRRKFVDSAISGLQEFLVECEKLVHKNEEIGDYFGVLATVSTILETRARIEWLRLVRDYVNGPLPSRWTETIMTKLDHE